MPTVAIIDGVKIQFYANEHPPVHFHARFAEYQAVFTLEPLEISEGFLPPDKRRKVLAWAKDRRAQLAVAFVQGISRDPVEPIE